MIYIVEKNKIKLSGNTSLFISFAYNEKIIKIIKASGAYQFHKDLRTWEVPLTSLAKLLDEFVFIDEVTLIVKEDESESKNKILPKSSFKSTLRDYQEEAVIYGLNHNKFLLLDEPGLGKAVSLDTPILTNKGFVPMRDIKVGDTLYDESGKECHVLKTYSHTDLEMYRITFNDGTFVDCCKDHLWKINYDKCIHVVKDGKKKTDVQRVDAVKNTDWIVNHNWKRARIVFPRCKPVQFDKKELSLHPYVLGVLLGDGHISSEAISLTSADDELIKRVNKYLPTNFYCKKLSAKYCYDITRDNASVKNRNIVKQHLKELGVLNCCSHEKFIPDIYKYSCVEDRVELLRGLLDTDGYAGKDNILMYCTTSPKLRDDVRFLVESLGGLVNIREKQGFYKKNGARVYTRTAYIMTIRIDDPSTLVTLTRKKEKLCKRKFLPRRMIKSIEKINTHEGKCITVDSASSLYLIKDFIVTHNTLEIICLAEELKEREHLEHCFVICGLASLRTNWMKEIEKHSKYKGMMLGARINRNGKLVWDSIAKRVEQLSKPIDEFFIITNIETIRDDRIIDALKNGPNNINMIAIDEGHCIKSWKSIQGNNLLELEADHKIVATGTPLLNSPLDTYMMLTWIGKESKRSITKFKDTYCVMDTRIRGRILSYKNLDMLQDELDSCSIRRTKDILNLPEKTIIDEVLDMSDAQKSFYDKIADSVNKESRQEGIDACDKIKLKPHLIRSFITRLRQATSCPELLTSQKVESIKVERAVELAKEILANKDEKVVIFSEYKQPIYKLQELLKEYNPLVNTGDISDGEFSSNIDKFQNDDKYRVFLGTNAKCGTGITLTRASYLLFIDTPWTYGAFEQSCDRIHRFGSKKPVFIYHLICKDTIDEAVAYLLNKKKSLSDFMIDNVVDDETLQILSKVISDL